MSSDSQCYGLPARNRFCLRCGSKVYRKELNYFEDDEIWGEMLLCQTCGLKLTLGKDGSSSYEYQVGAKHVKTVVPAGTILVFEDADNPVE